MQCDFISKTDSLMLHYETVTVCCKNYMKHRTKISKNPELFNVIPLAPEVIHLQDAV
jgi:hypothetical protein